MIACPHHSTGVKTVRLARIVPEWSYSGRPVRRHKRSLRAVHARRLRQLAGRIAPPRLCAAGCWGKHTTGNTDERSRTIRSSVALTRCEAKIGRRRERPNLPEIGRFSSTSGPWEAIPAPCGRSPRTACQHKARSANAAAQVTFPDFPRSLPEMMKSAQFLACPPPETRTLPRGGELSASADPHRATKETRLSTSADPHRAAELRLHRVVAFFLCLIRRPFRRTNHRGSRRRGPRGYRE